VRKLKGHLSAATARIGKLRHENTKGLKNIEKRYKFGLNRPWILLPIENITDDGVRIISQHEVPESLKTWSIAAFEDAITSGGGETEMADTIEVSLQEKYKDQKSHGHWTCYVLMTANPKARNVALAVTVKGLDK